MVPILMCDGVLSAIKRVLIADQQVWSKLTSGRLPSLGEMKDLLDNVHIPQMDQFSIAE